MAFFESSGLRRAPGLRPPDLQLEAGELRVVRGPNGCGKTLWLRALADLDPLEAGSVSLRGEACASMSGPRWRSLVRYVPAGTPRLPRSVAQVWGVLSGSRAELPAGLDPQAAHAELSTGQAQRLALYAALASSAPVLLLDEPTSALDPDHARAAEAAVLAAAAQGRALLWVAHDDQLAARLGAEELRLA